MKKRILALFLVVSLLGVCLVSCEDEKYGLLRYPPGSDDSTYLMMRDYENYKTYVNECKPLPSWFVTYEQLSFVGEFQSYEMHYSLDAYNAGYRLIDDTQVNVRVHYVHWYLVLYTYSEESLQMFQDEHATKEMDDAWLVGSSFKNIKTNESQGASLAGRYDRNGVVLTYNENGVLEEISWFYHGTEFKFSGLEDYPEDAEGTFVSRLLNPDTVDAAVAEFNLRVKGY